MMIVSSQTFRVGSFFILEREAELGTEQVHAQTEPTKQTAIFFSRLFLVIFFALSGSKVQGTL